MKNYLNEYSKLENEVFSELYSLLKQSGDLIKTDDGENEIDFFDYENAVACGIATIYSDGNTNECSLKVLVNSGVITLLDVIGIVYDLRLKNFK